MKRNLNLRPLLAFPGNVILFLCGKEQDGTVNRTVLWTMVSTAITLLLLGLGYTQLLEVKETTAAEFSHKIKEDLYTPQNLRLINLFDDRVLNFKCDTAKNIWFELDSNKYNKLPYGVSLGAIPLVYNIFEIDQLLQDFEDLAFYEKKGQIKSEYIYDQYSYYIIELWENPDLQAYITWQRSQPGSCNTYVNLENIYDEMSDYASKEAEQCSGKKSKRPAKKWH